jgi:hypothetical protein
LVVDELGVPGTGHLDAVRLVARPSDVGLVTTEVGEQQLEPSTPISCMHDTPQSQLG